MNYILVDSGNKFSYCSYLIIMLKQTGKFRQTLHAHGRVHCLLVYKFPADAAI